MKAKVKKQKILLTGGAGFIGSNLVEHLLATGKYQLLNLDALTYASHKFSLDTAQKNPDHCFIKGTIANKSLIHKLFKSFQPDCVLHLAAETHVDRSIDGPLNFVQTNVMGTANLLDGALKYWLQLKGTKKSKFKFIHVSTDEVFGHIEHPKWFDTLSPYSPRSPYAASKAAADHLVRAYQITYGLPTIVSNCSNNYGPRQHLEKLIPLAIQKILQGQAVPVYGDGQQVRDWIHVQDHCEALLKIIQRGKSGSTYLVSSMSPITNLDLLQILKKSFKILKPNLAWLTLKKQIQHVSDRPGHDRRYALDSQKTQDQLGWAPRTSIEDGLKETIQWYLDNEVWCQKILRGKYQLERLGKKIKTKKTYE